MSIIVLFMSCGQDDNPNSTKQTSQGLSAAIQIKADEASKFYKSMLLINKREIDIEKLNQLLADEKFDEIEALVHKIEEKYATNPAFEVAYLHSLSMFNGADESHLNKLNHWVRQKPSYVSYCARGSYEHARGFYFRGDKIVSETPKENFLKMHEIHQRAIQDLKAAIQQNPKCIPAYCNLIETYMASNSNDQAKAVHDQGIENIPSSYWIRLHYIKTLIPRWGGSYKQMQAYTLNLEDETRLNPAIWLLKGEEYADQAYLLFENREYQKIISLYTETLKYGLNPEALQYRGQAFFEMNNYQSSLDDTQAYLALYPDDPLCLQRQALCLAYTDHYEEALPALKRMIKMYPDYQEFQDALQYVNQNLPTPQNAQDKP